jgi:hypothetical protein
MSAVTIKSGGAGDEKPDWLAVVRQQVGSLSYGVVQIVVHDSQVTQIEKTERVRLDRPQKNSRPTGNPEAQILKVN